MSLLSVLPHSISATAPAIRSLLTAIAGKTRPSSSTRTRLSGVGVAFSTGRGGRRAESSSARIAWAFPARFENQARPADELRGGWPGRIAGPLGSANPGASSARSLQTSSRPLNLLRDRLTRHSDRSTASRTSKLARRAASPPQPALGDSPCASFLIVRHFASGRGSYGGRSSRSSGSGPSFRQRFDRIPPNYIVYGIIGINVGVFLLWQYATASWQRFRDPALYNWLARNFVVSEMNLMAGRVYTLLTGCFSHSTGSHILLNCLGLYFIAPSVVSLLGPSSFLLLYTGGGIISSLVSLGWHRLVTGGKGPKRGSEGASGAIYAALSFYATMFPYQQFLLFFIVPVPAWAAVGGIFAYDLYSSIRSPYAMTDSAGHVGGILAGVLFALASKGRRGGPRMPPWSR